MAKEQVLAKVAADLQRGHTHPALQRLASLTAAFPDDLEVRAHRAALHRQVGNLVEAGRWGFLSEDATAAEIRAFEKAYADVWQRVRSLKLKGDPTDQLGPLACARLTRLIAQAGQEGEGPVEWTGAGPQPRSPGSWREILPCLLAAVSGLIAVALAVLGLVTFLRWAL